MHDLAICLIRKHLETTLALKCYHSYSSCFKELSYIRWAFDELLIELFEYSDLVFVPEHISGRRKKGVFEIFDEFILKMEYFLSLGYNCGFDVVKHAVIQFRENLKNTGLFEEEVIYLNE